MIKYRKLENTKLVEELQFFHRSNEEKICSVYAICVRNLTIRHPVGLRRMLYNNNIGNIMSIYAYHKFMVTTNIYISTCRMMMFIEASLNPKALMWWDNDEIPTCLVAGCNEGSQSDSHTCWKNFNHAELLTVMFGPNTALVPCTELKCQRSLPFSGISWLNTTAGCSFILQWRMDNGRNGGLRIIIFMWKLQYPVLRPLVFSLLRCTYCKYF